MWLILWNNSPHNLLFFLSACTHTHHQEEERLRWIWLNGALSHERECISGWQRKPTNCNHLKNIIDFKPKSKRTLYHSNQEIDGHEKKDAQRKRKDTKKNRMRQATRSEWSSLGSALYSFFVSPTDFAFSSLDVSLCYRCCSSDFVLFFTSTVAILWCALYCVMMLLMLMPMPMPWIVFFYIERAALCLFSSYVGQIVNYTIQREHPTNVHRSDISWGTHIAMRFFAL